MKKSIPMIKYLCILTGGSKMATFKSNLIKVLAMTALVFAAFSFTACGPKPGDGSGSGGGSGSGSGGSGGGDGTPQLTAAQKAKLKALNGYEVTFEYNISDEAGTENGEYTLGEKGDVSWFITEGMGMALKIEFVPKQRA